MIGRSPRPGSTATDLRALSNPPADSFLHRNYKGPGCIGKPLLLLRTNFSSFDAIQHLPFRLRQVGHGQIDAGRKLEPQVRFAVDAQLATGQPELEDVSTGVPVHGYEVKVVARDVYTPGVV